MHPKQASRFEGFPTRAHVLCPSVTRLVRSVHSAHGAGHMELYTHARLENPSDPNSSIQPSFCPSAGSAYIHRVRFRTGFHSRRRTRQPRAKDGTNLAHAAVQIRRGARNSYGRYTAFVPRLVPSLSPFNRRTPTCHDAYTPCHDTRTCGCGLPHTNRHLPLIPQPHTRGFSHTRCFYHTRCFSHTQPFTHAGHFTYARRFTHTMRESQHAFCQTHEHTYRSNHTGDSRHHKRYRGLHTPQDPRVPVHSARPL